MEDEEDQPAYLDGYAAFGKGVARGDNPHNPLTMPITHALWEGGWLARYWREQY